MNRKRFTWKCTLQREDGEVIEKEFKSFWDPGKTESGSVANACAAQETFASKKKHVGISAQLVEA